MSFEKRSGTKKSEKISSKKQDTNCCVYDITIKRENIENYILVETFFKTISKKWCFQGETGEETGYRHYQCRISLLTKKRISQVRDMFFEWFDKLNLSPAFEVSYTSTENSTNNFYIIKSETREDGPWMDYRSQLDEEQRSGNVYIPRQCLFAWDVEKGDFKNLRPFQASILQSLKTEDYDHINMIANTSGFMGKSKFCLLLHKLGKMYRIPNTPNYVQLIEMIYSVPKKRFPEINAFCLDLPRGIRGEAMAEYLRGIETIKDGYLYDRRYSFKDDVIDSPIIWILANQIPDLTQITLKRWNIFDIDEKTFELIPLNTYEILKEQKQKLEQDQLRRMKYEKILPQPEYQDEEDFWNKNFLCTIGK